MDSLKTWEQCISESAQVTRGSQQSSTSTWTFKVTLQKCLLKPNQLDLIIRGIFICVYKVEYKEMLCIASKLVSITYPFVLRTDTDELLLAGQTVFKDPRNFRTEAATWRWPEPIACLETPRLRRRGLVFVQNLLVRLLERALLSGEGRIEGKLCPGQSSLSFQKPFNTACSFSWLLGAELFWNMSVCYSSGHCARPIAWGSRSRMSGRIGILC